MLSQGAVSGDQENGTAPEEEESLNERFWRSLASGTAGCVGGLYTSRLRRESPTESGSGGRARRDDGQV